MNQIDLDAYQRLTRKILFSYIKAPIYQKDMEMNFQHSCLWQKYFYEIYLMDF